MERNNKEEVGDMSRTENGKVAGQEDIPEETVPRESALERLTTLYNMTMESKRMPEEWRDSVLIQIV